jgi:hypothetical protein
MLMVVVHSHRHNKGEDFIKETSVDFTVVRDTMYKYSKKAQEKFFSFPIFAFLFAFFAKNSEGMEQLQKKFEQKGSEYCEKMKNEISELKEEAVGWLRKAAVSGKVPQACVLLSFLNTIN